MEQGILNGTFFNFLFGFILILSMSLGVLLAVNYYDITASGIAQAAASLFLFR